MIHWHAGGPFAWGFDRLGLLNGGSSFAYLPFDCTLGNVAACLTGKLPVRGSYRIVQNGTPISGWIDCVQNQVVVSSPLSSTTVLPGVTSGNLDGAAKLSIDVQVSDTSNAAQANIRFGLEIIPVNPVYAASEVWTIHAVDFVYSNPAYVGFNQPIPLMTTSAGSPFTSGFPYGTPGYANGYPFFYNSPFTSKASSAEQGETPGPGVGYYIGTATPLAFGGSFSNLMLVSATGGPDGIYNFTMRKNATDTSLSVTTSNGGPRIVTSAGPAIYQQGEFWDMQALQTSGASMFGHLLMTFTPGAVSSGGRGFGATGFGAGGFGT